MPLVAQEDCVVKLLLGVIALGSLALSGAALAQDTTTTADEPVSCDEILATPSASAEEIAELNDTSVVTVQECQADAAAVDADTGIADLRTAAAANPTLAPRFTAAGSAPEQVVAFRRGTDGAVTFYVIGGYR
jgi:hypothetical protein